MVDRLPSHKYLIFQYFIIIFTWQKQMMDEQIEQQNLKTTLSLLIDSIQFTKPKKKKTLSETQSISSNPSSQAIQSDIKQKSKSWTKEEVQLLQISIAKFGTDFHILSNFFPKKTKNQIKNKYKQLMALRKKQDRAEGFKLMAMAKMFQQVEQKFEKQDQN